MTAKGMLLDFLSTIFLIILICLFIGFFILGDRFTVFSEFVTAYAPYGVFAIPLLIIIKLRKKTFKKFENEDRLDEIIVHITPHDLVKDLLVNILLGLIIVIVALIDQDITFEDVIQAIGIVIFSYLWHRLLFRKKEDATQVISLDNLDRIKDEIIVFLTPLILLAAAAVIARVDLVDFIQALAVFLVMYIWHKIIFKGR